MEYLRSHCGRMGGDFVLATTARTPGSLVVVGMRCLLRGSTPMALYLATPCVCSQRESCRSDAVCVLPEGELQVLRLLRAVKLSTP